MTVTSKNQRDIPTGEGVYLNYAKRRNEVLRLLVLDKKVPEIAKILGKSSASVYMDLGKALTETRCTTYWGLLMEAMKLGWIEPPNSKGERPPCPE